MLLSSYILVAFNDLVLVVLWKLNVRFGTVCLILSCSTKILLLLNLDGFSTYNDWCPAYDSVYYRCFLKLVSWCKFLELWLLLLKEASMFDFGLRTVLAISRFSFERSLSWKLLIGDSENNDFFFKNPIKLLFISLILSMFNLLY